MTSALEELLDFIFDGQRSALQAEFECWVRGSRRFRAFAEAYRAKIRSKLKNVRYDEGLNDLRAELAAAVLLLRDERFMLEYEKYAASRQRGPDFTVTFRTHTPFNVEVRRLRGGDLNDDPGARGGKLIAVLCDKAGQMPPGLVNLLWLAAERAVPEPDLAQAAASLRQLAERKAEDFFTRRGFESAADFVRHFRRLSGIVVCQPDALTVWPHPPARHKLPPEIAAALRRLEPDSSPRL